MEANTFESLLAHATLALGDRREAMALLSGVLGISEAQLIGWPERTVDTVTFAHFSQSLERRVAGEPQAYIVGEKEFWSLPLKVTPATLIPRPETELLIEMILEKRPRTPQRLLDLCTGSGAIALALASERPHWHFTATDQSPEALAVAQANAEKLSLPVQFFQGDLFAAVPTGQYDIIVSNPPYLSALEWENATDLHYEPASAFIAAEAGLALIQRIFAEALPFLAQDGVLCVEHGYQQGPQVADMARTLGYIHVETRNDALGHPRLCWAQRPSLKNGENV